MQHIRHFIHRVPAKHDRPHVQFFQLHFVPRQCPRLVAQEVLDPPKLFGKGACPDDRLRDLVVIVYLTGVDCLAHI